MLYSLLLIYAQVYSQYRKFVIIVNREKYGDCLSGVIAAFTAVRDFNVFSLTFIIALLYTTTL